MSLLHLRIIAKDPEHHVPNWERLSRVLLLKLAGRLREAKKQKRFYRDQVNLHPDNPMMRELWIEARGIEREANNTFQGAKEWWRMLAPQKEKE